MQQFSMNPDPISWIEVEDGKLAFDQYPDGSFQFRVTYLPDVLEQTVILKSTLPAAIMALGQVTEAMQSLGMTYSVVIQTLPDQRGDKPLGKRKGCKAMATNKIVTLAMIVDNRPNEPHPTSKTTIELTEVPIMLAYICKQLAEGRTVTLRPYHEGERPGADFDMSAPTQGRH